MMNVLYMTEQAFEQGQLIDLLIGKAPYTIYEEPLKQGITDTNGAYYPNTLKDILRWNRVTKENDGIQLLPIETSASTSPAERP